MSAVKVESTAVHLCTQERLVASSLFISSRHQSLSIATETVKTKCCKTTFHHETNAQHSASAIESRERLQVFISGPRAFENPLCFATHRDSAQTVHERVGMTRKSDSSLKDSALYTCHIRAPPPSCVTDLFTCSSSTHNCFQRSESFFLSKLSETGNKANLSLLIIVFLCIVYYFENKIYPSQRRQSF